MDDGEHVQRPVAPVVRLVEGRLVVRPVDVPDPVVAEQKPHDQKGGERETADFGADGRGQHVVAFSATAVRRIQSFVSKRFYLTPHHPQHLHQAEAATHHHVHRDMRLFRAVSHELGPCECTTNVSPLMASNLPSKRYNIGVGHNSYGPYVLILAVEAYQQCLDF